MKIEINIQSLGINYKADLPANTEGISLIQQDNGTVEIHRHQRGVAVPLWFNSITIKEQKS